MKRRQIVVALVSFPAAGFCEIKVVGETARDYFGDGLQANLAKAGAEGRVEEVQRLIRAGAQVNAAGKQNMTPLVWALTARNVAGMRALLQGGADPNQRVGPERNFHPVWLAAGQDESGPLAVLLEFKGDPNAPHKGSDYVPLARALSKFTNFKLLVSAGANINAADILGNPVVLDAASLAQYDNVLYALDHGFNKNLPLLAWELHDRRPDGKAPLPPHKEPGRLKVLEKLRQMGVEPPAGPAPKLNPADATQGR
jgi:ankyrin repeat protein